MLMEKTKKGHNITLTAATIDDSLLISRLLELYVYDFTEFMDFDVDEEGLFHYPYETYFSEPDHHIYVARVNDKIAGLVLLHKCQDAQDVLRYSIGEFFVLKKYRNQGIGQLIANMIFSLYPGPWLIYQSKKNKPAQAFWRKIINEWTHGNYREYYKDEKPHQEFEITCNSLTSQNLKYQLNKD